MKLTELKQLPKVENHRSGETTPATLKVDKGIATLIFRLDQAEVRTSKKNENYRFLTVVFDEIPAPFTKRSWNLPL